MAMRPMKLTDIGTVTSIFCRAFHDESMNRVLFPHRNEFPADYALAKRQVCWEQYWNYSKTTFVTYDTVDGKEVLTGVIGWTRHGDGWEKLWGIKGRWDPRLLITPFINLINRIQRYLFPNRASVQPSPSDPNPLTFWNWLSAVMPYTSHYFIPPNATSHSATHSSSSSSNPATTSSNTDSGSRSGTAVPLPTDQKAPGPPFWELAHLAVDPAHQGKGIARVLVAQGMKVAREENLPVIVVASEFRERFYQRCGFGEIVGWGTDGEGNPLKAWGIGGGAIMWTDWPYGEEKKKRQGKEAEEVLVAKGDGKEDESAAVVVPA